MSNVLIPPQKPVFSELVMNGLRYARYMALAKTCLQYIVTAAAMNLSRMWAIGRKIPIGLTSVSSFWDLFISGGS
ncbi:MULTISPECIES: hypothetical protein [unclassified Microcoleus]|uniref:hypothetical protein n=1 Tax=unclassified Microcoleus TaxID=2642155 RepID=UPI002FD47802